MLLHIDVKNKVATYQKRDGCIVCGNSGYKIKFNLDSEWANVDAAGIFAIFIWNGQTREVRVDDDRECEVPIISNAESVTVGVYSKIAGMATTGTKIPCKKSILCG